MEGSTLVNGHLGVSNWGNFLVNTILLGELGMTLYVICQRLYVDCECVCLSVNLPPDYLRIIIEKYKIN